MNFSQSAPFTHLLPPEIVEQIARRLSVKDQYRCLCVCKQWHQEFRRALYRVVHIRRRWQFKSFYRSLLLTQETSDPIGYLVREFSLHHKVGMSVKEMQCLPVLCPFLVAVDGNWGMWRHLPQRSQALKLFKNVKRFSPFKYRNDFEAVINTVGKDLTHLCLRHNVLASFPSDEFPLRTLIGVMSLTHLELSGVPEGFYAERYHITLSPQDMVIIRSMCQELQHMSFTRIRFVYDETRHFLDRGYKRLSKLRSLKFESCKMEHYKWIRYFGFNYDKLESLDWSFDFDDPAFTQDPDAAGDALLYLAQNATKLKKLKLCHMPARSWPGPEFFEKLEENQIQLEEVSITFWTYPRPTEMDLPTFITMLDACSKNLRSLTMQMWLDLEMQIEMITQPLNAYAIQKLSLVGGNTECYLYTDLEVDIILDYLPHLKDLSIASNAFAIRDPSIDQEHGLESLSMNLITIKQGSMDYLALRCPHLKRLSMHNSVWEQPYDSLSTEMMIDMPFHEFEEIDVARMSLGFLMDDGQYQRLTASAIIALTPLGKVERTIERRMKRTKDRAKDGLDIDMDEFASTRWYHLHSKNDMNPVSKTIRRLSIDESKKILRYHLLPDELQVLDDDSFRLTYKKWDQWWMDIPFGYINIRCRSIEELCFDSCKIR
ncbi:hypothetical protein DFQ28_008623 [Apophysomyces sp. BC1034]|nr:hypothetical protein DFQ30_008350 [Apophysomyces sp. BC1015]KAG0185885.1 hypothetical protein DFQ28_008623 [Apophysomyces sp. BC1034]